MADRFPKRSILYVTQALSGMLALTVGVLVITDLVQLWMLYVLGLMLGFITVFDNPARQTFVREMVGAERLTNAVSLSSMEFNLARVIGPIDRRDIGGDDWAGRLLHRRWAVLHCGADCARDDAGRRVAAGGSVASGKGQLMNGLRYVRTQPVLLNTLIMMAIVGMFTYEFSVMLPLFAGVHVRFRTRRICLDDGGDGRRGGGRWLVCGPAGGDRHSGCRSPPARFRGVSMITALMPTLDLAVASLLIVGFFSITLRRWRM